MNKIDNIINLLDTYWKNNINKSLGHILYELNEIHNEQKCKSNVYDIENDDWEKYLLNALNKVNKEDAEIAILKLQGYSDAYISNQKTKFNRDKLVNNIILNIENDIEKEVNKGGYSLTKNYNIKNNGVIASDLLTFNEFNQIKKYFEYKNYNISIASSVSAYQTEKYEININWFNIDK